MAQSGRSPIYKVAELHVGHSAREVGNQAARGFTIPAAFLAFARATSTSASNAKALPMRRIDEALGLPNRRMSEWARAVPQPRRQTRCLWPRPVYYPILYSLWCQHRSGTFLTPQLPALLLISAAMPL